MSADWGLEVRSALVALTGNVVTDAWVNEMAFYGPDHSGHFTDPNLDFIQANLLELRTSDGQTFQISCVQDDDEWVMWPRFALAEERLFPDPGEGTFRTRPMSEFPRGTVSKLQISPAAGTGIQEIRMTINAREVFLRAGEVYEDANGTLTVCDRDESVLVFLNGEVYAQLTFNEPVYRPFYA